MTLEPLAPERAVELYLDHRRNEVAAQTLRSHESRLQYFTTWCDENVEEDRVLLTPQGKYFICEIEANGEELNEGPVRCYCP